MARTVEKLTALKIGRKLPPGMHSDGGGLYLQVTGAGAKSWIFRFSLGGKAREMGLGSLAAVSLADAREKAKQCRGLCQADIDPIEHRKATREAAALERAKAVSFKEAAEQYIASHRAGWRNAKHGAQWGSTLTTYVYPTLGGLPVQAVDAALVRKVLEPIWQVKPETANRVRGRIEVILDWARARGMRAGDNPARWRGHLQFDFPARAKIRPVRHHTALPYSEVPGFIAKLREQEGIAARALEFTILTAARTGEAIGATWGEINTAEKAWAIPAARMKGGREHRVPLGTRALGILSVAAENASAECEGFIFPGGRTGKPLSNMAMLALLRRMKRDDITVHGFRSAFRDWAAERTNFPSEVVEMALAHAVGDKVEAAYRRGDLFDKRRQLMAAWDSFCGTPNAAGRDTVVPIRRRG